MAAKRQPIGFIVRRPLTLWGVERKVGDYVPLSEVVSMTRLESMVRAGRFNPVYEIGDERVEMQRGNRRAVDKTPVSVDESTELDDVSEPAPRKRAAKKVAPKEESNA